MAKASTFNHLPHKRTVPIPFNRMMTPSEGEAIDHQQRLWCFENCDGAWESELYIKSYDQCFHLRFHFEKEEDAILFTLRW